MGKFIPNENTWVGFRTTVGSLAAPTVAEVNGAIDLTAFVTGLNLSAQGNAVPTPSFDTLFETSILGTSQATASMDFYRDDTTDTAWDTLPRATKGYFIVARYGGIPNSAGRKVEVWPVTVLSRAVSQEANNSPVAFTVSCAVPVEPAEDAIVAA